MNVIDLRSDAVTLPSREMLASMMRAELGGDLLGEDPTVRELQELAARMFGAEDALLLISGTQANLVAMMAHCRRGDKVIVDSKAEIYRCEVDGMVSIAVLAPMPIEGSKGTFTGDQVRQAAKALDSDASSLGLLVLENTHHHAGGTCWTPSQVADAAQAAHELGLKVHMDGARVFNAAVALGVPVSDYMRHVDSIQFSLSKGLGCPMGSILVGDSDFIDVARKRRGLLGGGMRKAGAIAAPGIVALNTMVDRLSEDHANARRLVDHLEVLEEIVIDRDSVQTNMVVADISATGMTAEAFVAKAREKGLMVSVLGPSTICFVTHRGITEEDVERAAMIVESVIPACRSGVCYI